MAQATVFAPFVKLAKQVSARGWKGTLTQLYTIGDLKFGELKGTDSFGNKYYEDQDLPFGQHRWVEYADIHNPDATMIQPEWHGWMHHMFDETPDEMKLEFEVLGSALASDADATFPHHVNLETLEKPEKPLLDVSNMRPRGYGIGSLHSTYEEGDISYKQDGHALAQDTIKRKNNKNRVEDLLKGGNPLSKKM
jgi:NADH:ubiquinone oxidoreductase subunit